MYIEAMLCLCIRVAGLAKLKFLVEKMPIVLEEVTFNLQKILIIQYGERSCSPFCRRIFCVHHCSMSVY